MDEALALPTETSARLALRTQQVIASETNVTQVVDPLGGSYFVESLTAQIEDGVWKYLDDIEARGGTVKCIEDGYIQTEILNTAYQDQRKMDAKVLEIVGVNIHQDKGAEKKIELMKIAPELEARSVATLNAYRAKRDSGKSKTALKNLSDGAKSDANLMELIYQCVKADCTLGEIADELRAVFGEHLEYSGF